MPQMHDVEGAGTAGPDGTDDTQRVAALRGAGVDVDPARLGFVAAVVALAAVVVVAGVLLAAGVKKNAQIASLTGPDVVHVDATVTKCLALVGGTGSSPAGFECTATYTYHGTAYTEGVPGTVDREVGSTVHGIVATDDPALFSTPQAVASEHTDAARVMLPALVLVLAAAGLVGVVVRRRRRRPSAG
jgi:hypothetical protein